MRRWWVGCCFPLMGSHRTLSALALALSFHHTLGQELAVFSEGNPW